ncbi:hypothetical protein [Chryseobacterium daeguense]|uniref:hypothetical protein n=1 Tax=Chryseobacterium daeguense TaxID=412438 RepID=UPI00040AEB3C|nr:hypothetical protein [Chryseobacterium daeguense]
MKKIILKLLGWLILFSLGGYALLLSNNCTFYGDYLIRQKVKYYYQHENEYNALILGSSRMYRQVNPGLLDSATHHTIKAYNLATGGTFFTESRYVFRHLKLNKNIKYLLFEIQDLQPFEGNSYTEKIMYYHDLPTVAFECKYYKKNKDISSSFLPISHYIANILYFKKLAQRDKPVNEFANYNNGYYPLEKDYDKIITVKELRDRFVKDSTGIVSKSAELQKVNPTIIKDLKNLALNCQKQKIQLILICPPFGTPSDLSEIRAIRNTKVIDFTSREKFKEFYTFRNAYDHGHLNQKGALLFSNKLADSLNLYLKK